MALPKVQKHLSIFALCMFYCSLHTAHAAQEKDNLFHDEFLEEDLQLVHEKIHHPSHHTQHTPSSQTFSDEYDYEQAALVTEQPFTIANIIVQGNFIASTSAILSKTPFKQGDAFEYKKTSELIKNVYSLGFFTQVKVYADVISNDQLNVYIYVTEKPKLVEVIYQGNKNVGKKALDEYLDIEHIKCLDISEVDVLIKRMRKKYAQNNFLSPEFTYDYTLQDNNKSVVVTFHIKENHKTVIQEIDFVGNKMISSKSLKKVIVSREEWLFSPLDKAGSYQKEMLEADKALIEDTYKSYGFLHAQVTQTETKPGNRENSLHVTYHISEGDIYFIKTITVPGNEILSEAFLKARIPLKENEPYSVKKIRDSIEALQLLWGEYGYIFADIEPSIDVDEEHKTVSVAFYSDLKEKAYLRRLTVKGNKKSFDKVLRRQTTLDEGELITNKKMDDAKGAIQRLGYFEDPDGVSWKITRVDDTHADLDLLLKEKKTGQFNVQLGYGGSLKNMNNPQNGLNVQIIAADRNVLGTGISASANAEIGQRYRSIVGSIINPWLFEKPLRGELSAYRKQSLYNDGIQHAQDDPNESVYGGYVGVGYTFKALQGIFASGQFGGENIVFAQRVKVAQRLGSNSPDALEFQTILDENFRSGNQIWLQTNIGQDLRNGYVYPTSGHAWNWSSRIAVPANEKGFNYFKSEIDASWYTSLIGQDALVLCLHSHIGYIKEMNHKHAPWRELFHVGGPASVRGYTYGQISPLWKDENSLGGRKMVVFNAELIFPITPDRTMRGVVFYDGGTGWDTPFADTMNPANLSNNKFSYRHSFGVGIRFVSPTPMQIDFGIKLNPSKKFKKELTQLHFNMIHEF
jgi:outer membrane protein insertion porin family